jgi:two-component system sensor histidine kinase EvgS
MNRAHRLRGLLLAGCLFMTVSAAVFEVPTASKAASEAASPFTVDERAWLATHPVIPYAIDPSWPPLEYLDKGVPKGLSIEYLKEIAKLTGIRFELVPTRSWAESLSKFASGEVKLLPGTTARRILLDGIGSKASAYPYYSGTTVAVSRGDRRMILDPQGLAGLRVAVARDGETNRWLSENVPDATYLLLDSPQEMLDAVVAGDADVAVGPEIVLLPPMRRAYRGDLNAAGIFPQLPVELSILVAPDQIMMRSVLDKLVRGLTALQTDEVFDHWLDDADFGRPSIAALLHYYWVPGALAAALCALLALTALIAVTARRAAKQADAEKSRFVAVMSHEIRNAMNAVVGPIDMLWHAPDSDVRMGLLSTARSGSKLLLHTVNNLLDLSKLQARKATLSVQPTSIGEIVDEIAAMVDGSVLDKKLQLHLNVGRSLRVLIDGARYRQVVLNLVTNAVKFTQQGEIFIGATLDCSGVRPRLLTAVRDTGIGIAPDALKRLFVDYARVESESNAKISGTGLSLSICKEIVQLMGGSISATSIAGEGTTVTFELPVELVPASLATADSGAEIDAVQSQAAAFSAATSHAPTSHGATSQVASSHAATIQATTSKASIAPLGVVLVIDDSEVNRRVLADQLSVLGFDSHLCDGAESALSAWREGAYVVVFMDCQMPGIDGYELCRMMRREEAANGLTPSIILALSARTENAHAEACFDAGMNGVLVKPLDMESLRSTLGMWTGSVRNQSPEAREASGENTESLEAKAESLEALFHRSCVADGAAIRDAVSRRDSKEVADHAHRLKGAALTFGHANVAKLAAEIETMSMHVQCDWTALAHKVHGLNDAFAKRIDPRD